MINKPLRDREINRNMSIRSNWERNRKEEFPETGRSGRGENNFSKIEHSVTSDFAHEAIKGSSREVRGGNREEDRELLF